MEMIREMTTLMFSGYQFLILQQYAGMNYTGLAAHKKSHRRRLHQAVEKNMYQLLKK